MALLLKTLPIDGAWEMRKTLNVIMLTALTVFLTACTFSIESTPTDNTDSNDEAVVSGVSHVLSNGRSVNCSIIEESRSVALDCDWENTYLNEGSNSDTNNEAMEEHVVSWPANKKSTVCLTITSQNSRKISAVSCDWSQR